MPFLELNTHTGEKRLHTESSVISRLRALNIPLAEIGNLCTDGSEIRTPHSSFRFVSSFHSAGITMALPNGAWGELIG